MSYVLSCGTVGNAIMFFRDHGEDPYTAELKEAMAFESLEDAERVALSSRVHFRHKILDEKDVRRQVAHSIWDADKLKEAVSYVNTVTESTIRESVGMAVALVKEVEGINPDKAENAYSVLQEIAKRNQPAAKV